MKNWPLPASSSVYKIRQRQQLARSSGQLRTRGRSDHKAVERGRRRRGDVEHREMGHGHDQ